MINAVKLKDRLEGISDNIAGLNPFVSKLKQIPVGSTPRELVGEFNKCKVYRYATETPVDPKKQPMLFVPSLINRPFILDLLPEKSMIRFFCDQGYPVYLLDWGTPSDEDRFLPFVRYVRDYINNAVEIAKKNSHAEQVHLMGHCLGGTFSLIYASLRPSQVCSLTLMTAPFDFSQTGLLTTWAQNKSFNLEGMIEAYGNAPWPLLQASFNMLRPTLITNKIRTFIERSGDEKFMQGFLAMELWSNDNVSFPGECYKTMITEFYRKNSLAHQELVLDGQRIELSSIQAPIFSIICEDDHIVPPAAMHGFESHFPKSQLNVERRGGGHIGGLISSRARKELWPQLNNWLNESNKAQLH